VHHTFRRVVTRLLMMSILAFGLLPAVAHAGVVNVSLSNGVVTVTGSGTNDEITVDYVNDTNVTPNARFELAARSGTTSWGTVSPGSTTTCIKASSTLARCAASALTGFSVALAGGDDRLNLRDEDPSRGSETMNVSMGAGNDVVSTFGLCLFFNGTSTCNEYSRGGSWSDPITVNGEDDNDSLNGGAGNDTLSGGNGNDTLSGSSGDDSLSGGADDDTLNGAAGADTLNGSIGNDTLNGGSENDTLSGSSGDDTLNGGSENDSINGSSGNDTLIGEAGDDTLTPGTETDTVDGGDGVDTVSYATPFFLCLFGGCGDPPPPTPVTVSLDGAANDGGPGENDNVGPGVENITGGNADDTLIGDDGPNVIVGNGGNDTLDSGAGDDSLNGGDGDDAVSGGGGADTLRGGAGADTLDGGADADNLGGEADADVLNGGPGEDNLRGDGGADVLDGGEDADNAGGGPGTDDLRDGGTVGADTIDYSDATTPVKVDLGGGGGMGPADDPDALSPGFEHAIGGTANDDLNGSAADNRLIGGPGNDLIDGLAGNDTLSGGDGNDRLDGGDGADTVLGEAGADRLEGGAGSDPKLDGGDGPDVLTGGPGGTDDADVLGGGQGRDLLTYESRTSGVTVTLDNVANDGGPNEKDNANADIEAVFGGAGADTLRLNVPVRLLLIPRPIIAPLVRPVLFTSLIRPTTTTTIAPRARTAQLGKIVEPGRIVQGGGGNDTIIGTSGNDIISGGAGRDTIKLLGGNDAGYGGSGDDSIDGGDGNNRLYGNEGSDLIVAGIGEDFINAADRRGIDRVVCGDGKDTFLRDALDLIRKGSNCDRSIGIPKLTLPGAKTEPTKPGEEPPIDVPFDAADLCGETGDDFCSPLPEEVQNPDGTPLSPDDEWAIGFGLDDFDSFGAENDFDFFGYDDSFGDFDNPKELASAVMKIKNKGKKAAVAKKGKDKNAFRVRLECPKAATRRCVGEMTITLKPKKGKTKELGSELFRTNKGKTANLRFKLSKKLRKLIPKGKKGASARVLVEARDGGELLFGLDETVKITR